MFVLRFVCDFCGLHFRIYSDLGGVVRRRPCRVCGSLLRRVG